MSKLSVVIVNYNVKYFLEQCLLSVNKAIESMDVSSDVIVVDNASSDGSVEMLREKFPLVKLIPNDDNPGFSKANNQAIRICDSEYILLLNPDTIVEEDTFSKCISFMDEHTDAGALGVKMLDGKGNFLPESKRGLPTPTVAFYKTFGLSSLFPKSKTFGRYHLGYLNEDDVNEVDVLSGAFMFLRKSVLDKIGLLDEDYFMYGEDIDLSYRVQKGGFKNYYYPDTRIIHYKGESTRKGSLNYVKIFYQAMIIFAGKHFSKNQARLYSNFISTGIYFRAFISAIFRLIKNIALPTADLLLMLAGMYLIKEFWATNIKGAPEYYPAIFLKAVVPVYLIVWWLGMYINGVYDHLEKTYTRIIRGIALGTLTIAAVYAFLPESWRFSRAMIVLGAVWSIFSVSSFRMILQLIFKDRFSFSSRKENRLAIIGENEESSRAIALLNQAGAKSKLIGFVSPNDAGDSELFLGSLENLADIVEAYRIDEIVFCGKDVQANTIIKWMINLGSRVSYKIFPEKGIGIIGSDSKNVSGDLYAIDINLALNDPVNRRKKRILDVSSSILMLLTIPLCILFVRNKAGFIKNIFKVLSGKMTWIGYTPEIILNLPPLSQGVLSPLDGLSLEKVENGTLQRLNQLYAKDYSVSEDLQILLRSVRELGRTEMLS